MPVRKKTLFIESTPQRLCSPLHGYLAHQRQLLRYDHHMAHGVVLLQGPREGRFLMSDVYLHRFFTCAPDKVQLVQILVGVLKRNNAHRIWSRSFLNKENAVGPKFS